MLFLKLFDAGLVYQKEVRLVVHVVSYLKVKF